LNSGNKLSSNLNSDLMGDIKIAAVKIQQEDVVAFPTETVYGLGARISSDTGIRKIFSTKERPFFDPLIVHVHSVEQAKTCFKDWNVMAEILTQNFWPGPLTLVMPKSDIVSDVITSGLVNVGVRMPKHPVALELIKQVGEPIAAPSANKFGKTSPTHAKHVVKEFGQQVMVLDQGSSEIGIESTVLMVKQNGNQFELAILRKGAILKKHIEDHLKTVQVNYQWTEQIDKKDSPGHMKHHYMPEIPFVVCRNPNLKLSELAEILNSRLNDLPDEVESVKIVKPKTIIDKVEFLNLSKDAEQAARELYSQLRAASDRQPQVLCFIQMPYHSGEMWESIFDRLYKAASLIID